MDGKMPIAIDIDFTLRDAIEASAMADSRMCWTCGSCDFECPVNMAVGRLRPQFLLRLADFGMLDELLRRPEIWYCLSCNRCSQVCPNLVKPANIIAFARQENILQGRVPWPAFLRYQKLFTRFQQARWHAALWCQSRALRRLPEGQWQRWLGTGPDKHTRPMRLVCPPKTTCVVRPLPHGAMTSACFACAECASACPVSCGARVFDVRAIVRLVSLGFERELMASPSLWLCVGCQRCTGACPMRIQIHRIIEDLKNAAVAARLVDPWYPRRLENAHRFLFERFIPAVDAIFG